MADDFAREPAGRAVVIDDDANAAIMAARALRKDGFVVQAFGNAKSALAAIDDCRGAIDVVLTDLHMPEMSGIEMASALRERWPEIAVLVITGLADVTSVVQALRLGVYDYLVKPVDPFASLLPTVRRALERKRLIDRNRYLQQQLDVSARFDGMVGSSRALRQVEELTASVAPTSATVLIVGESGTGKELVARAIHEQSPRHGRAFVDINCGALAESVLESELFGHVRGAFTGAIAARRGLFEEASGGTIFLDEIAELSPPLQARLLRVLQEGHVRPVGGNDTRDVDVRVIAATNRDLDREVKDKRFREDLYYRLNVIKIEVPPLRARVEDVAALAHHFLRKRGAKIGKIVEHIEPAALERLCSYPWPGNVRELENVIERAIILTRTDTITLAELPDSLKGEARPVLSESIAPVPLAEARDAFEQRYVQMVMARAGGSMTEAARIAGVDRSNFRRIFKRLKGTG